MKKVNAILSADEHWREDRPQCRTDDYQKAQSDKLNFLADLQVKYNCPIISAGDLLHKARVSPWLERFLINNLPNNYITVPGNHDIPNHNIELYDKSSLSVLEASERLIVLSDGKQTNEIKFGIYGLEYGNNKKIKPLFVHDKIVKSILIFHTMTWKGREPYPGAAREGCGATALLKKYPEFDLIVTGHNHQSFVVEYEGRLLVNPGSAMRMTTDQINHRPCVYLWNAESNAVEPMYYPIKQDVINAEHITEIKERDGRIGAFVNQLKTDTELELSFEKNLETFIANNDIHEDTEKIIWEVLNND